MALDNSVKEEIIKKYGKTAEDCGSSEVQIALLTENKDINSYENLIKQLGLRK